MERKDKHLQSFSTEEPGSSRMPSKVSCMSGYCVDISKRVCFKITVGLKTSVYILPVSEMYVGNIWFHIDTVLPILFRIGF